LGTEARRDEENLFIRRSDRDRQAKVGQSLAERKGKEEEEALEKVKDVEDLD
jgi:hypothetical protein